MCALLNPGVLISPGQSPGRKCDTQSFLVHTHWTLWLRVWNLCNFQRWHCNFYRKSL